ncbi:hypothetical protein HDU99_000364, partial [Rhizoclosmatium hyalinum]
APILASAAAATKILSTASEAPEKPTVTPSEAVLLDESKSGDRINDDTFFTDFSAVVSEPITRDIVIDEPLAAEIVSESLPAEVAVTNDVAEKATSVPSEAVSSVEPVVSESIARDFVIDEPSPAENVTEPLPAEEVASTEAPVIVETSAIPACEVELASSSVETVEESVVAETSNVTVVEATANPVSPTVVEENITLESYESVHVSEVVDDALAVDTPKVVETVSITDNSIQDVTITTTVDEKITETITVTETANGAVVVEDLVITETPGLVTLVDVIETKSSDTKVTETIIITETKDAEVVEDVIVTETADSRVTKDVIITTTDGQVVTETILVTRTAESVSVQDTVVVETVGALPVVETQSFTIKASDAANVEVAEPVSLDKTSSEPAENELDSSAESTDAPINADAQETAESGGEKSSRRKQHFVLERIVNADQQETEIDVTADISDSVKLNDCDIVNDAATEDVETVQETVREIATESTEVAELPEINQTPVESSESPSRSGFFSSLFGVKATPNHGTTKTTTTTTITTTTTSKTASNLQDGIAVNVVTSESEPYLASNTVQEVVDTRDITETAPVVTTSYATGSNFTPVQSIESISALEEPVVVETVAVSDNVIQDVVVTVTDDTKVTETITVSENLDGAVVTEDLTVVETPSRIVVTDVIETKADDSVITETITINKTANLEVVEDVIVTETGESRITKDVIVTTTEDRIVTETIIVTQTSEGVTVEDTIVTETSDGPAVVESKSYTLEPPETNASKDAIQDNATPSAQIITEKLESSVSEVFLEASTPENIATPAVDDVNIASYTVTSAESAVEVQSREFAEPMVVVADISPNEAAPVGTPPVQILLEEKDTSKGSNAPTTELVEGFLVSTRDVAVENVPTIVEERTTVTTVETELFGLSTEKPSNVLVESEESQVEESINSSTIKPHLSLFDVVVEAVETAVDKVEQTVSDLMPQKEPVSKILHKNLSNTRLGSSFP